MHLHVHSQSAFLAGGGAAALLLHLKSSTPATATTTPKIVLEPIGVAKMRLVMVMTPYVSEDVEHRVHRRRDLRQNEEGKEIVPVAQA